MDPDLVIKYLSENGEQVEATELIIKLEPNGALER